MFGEIFFKVIVNALYEHAIKAHLFEEIGHGGRVAEWINGPTVFGRYGWINVGLEPFMTENLCIGKRF